MTYGEALELGYTYEESKLMYGYISRKIDIYKQPVLEDKGLNKGRLYVDLPSFTTNIYYIRQYLNKPSERL